MVNLGHQLGRGTIRRILKDAGIEPAPERGKHMPWSVFLKAPWKAVAALFFFSVEVWSWKGLETHYVLFVIELATRRVSITGITIHPDTAWMLQMARQLTNEIDGILVGKRYLILVTGYEVLPGVPRLRDTRRHRGDSFTATFAKSERLRRALGGQCGDRVRIEAHSDRAGDAAPCAALFRGALSPGTQSLGDRQRADHAAPSCFPWGRTGGAASTAWRTAQLLRACRCVKLIPVFEYDGVRSVRDECLSRLIPIGQGML